MPQATHPVTVHGYDLEVDTYSADHGSDAVNLRSSGGSAVIRATVGGAEVTVAVSSADLDRALGRALALVVEQDPPAGAASLRITGYIDSETSEYAELAREER